ncbi:MAG: exodeoxyribonuclease VII large subunit [Christensenellaceae bacterium]
MQFSSAMRPVTVGQLNQYLKEKLARDDALQSICVEGEISNLTLHTSGHIDFTLKDASAAIRAVLFRGYRTSLKFIPANGMRVLLIGDVALYERNGGVQIYVQRMLQAGRGEISLQYEQLKRPPGGGGAVRCGT